MHSVKILERFLCYYLNHPLKKTFCSTPVRLRLEEN
jgi:hypothetical protein